MRWIAVNDKNEMSDKAAQIIIHLVRKRPDAILGLATGGTPEGTYRKLVEDHVKNMTSYHSIRSVNLDEYVGLRKNEPNSYHAYMKNHFFDRVDILPENCFLPDGNAKDLEAACAEYDRLIAQLGGIDLQLLGIGRNGHIGFNEPGTSLDIGTHVVTLTESTRAANARYFNRIDDVPKQAVTMGIGTIMKSKAILLIVSGEAKAEAVKKLLDAKEPARDFPASVLIRHPDVTVIADQSALSLSGGRVGSAQ